jgi:hypothetical protein
MKTYLITLIFSLTCSLLNAQQDTIRKSNYKCIIGLINVKKEISGELFKTDDTSITMMKVTRNYKSYNKTDFELMPISVSSLEYLEFKKKGDTGKGIVIGGLSGLLIGGLIGFASGDDEQGGWENMFAMTAGEKAVVGGILGIIPGALIGLAVGSSKNIFIGIHGNNEKYNSSRKRMDKFSIEH